MTRLHRQRKRDTAVRPPRRLRPLLLGALWALGCTAIAVAVVLLATR